MSGWDIKPQGVQGQLRVVGVHAGELEKALSALMKDLGEAARSAGTAVAGTGRAELECWTATGSPSKGVILR
ncbi:hypothetical protein A3Q37_07133 [Streptomyces sp. PTY087I2]|nr:hypothetical protein A3Q37_07133 [Streptomyces sp. PTY087I2]